MNRQALLLLLLCGVLSATASTAADHSIVVPPKVAVAWGFVTNSTAVKPSRTLGVGFWQRGSGAQPGVGVNFVSTMEYQLPEAAPNRVRSAVFQFSGRPAQCVGAEPVVIEVYAYNGDGRSDVADASAGSRIAQLSADCNSHDAFSRPIDVTHIVRQAIVAAGVRFVGFNVRKANNRQGPGLFELTVGKLTVVLADQDVDRHPATHPQAATMPPRPAPVAAAVAPPRAAQPVPNKIAKQ
jgi:hypothetical protein